jgi:hypothetical protein
MPRKKQRKKSEGDRDAPLETEQAPEDVSREDSLPADEEAESHRKRGRHHRSEDVLRTSESGEQIAGTDKEERQSSRKRRKKYRYSEVRRAADQRTRA